MSDADHSVLDTALAALDRGFCPIPARVDGTKRPIGRWEHWQKELPPIEQVHAWYDNGHPAIGIVCGAVSGGLEFLEFEASAVGLIPEFKARLAAAGLGDLFQMIGRGYFENSPAGGLHIAYRIDGEVPGNTKLAARRNADNTVTTLIETRGEGGFMVVAPSHGPTHPSGNPYILRSGGWDTVHTISRAQRDAIAAVCESFDEMPPAPPPDPPRLTLVRGDSWIDATLSEWNQGNPIETVLARHGWTYLETDSLGQLWRRPGKERGSCSARVNTNRRLHVFSTSTPFRAGGRGATTYDALDVELTYTTGRVPSADDRTTALRIIGAELGTYTPTTGFEFVGTGSVTEPSTFGLLPDAFWEARPMFGHIRTAAHARGVAPDAVMLAFLARYATTIPTTLLLPPIVGSMATFDLIAVLVSPSGGGKTSAMAIAAELFDVEFGERLLFDPPIGSGEGLVQAFLKIETVKIDGEKVQQQVQVLDGLHIGVDEGTVLRAQMGREGTIVAQTLCSAWSGTSLGQLNARTDTRRIIPAHHARLTAVMGMQTAHGEFLVSGAAADMGLTQRLVFASLVDPRIPPRGERPSWPHPRLEVPQVNPHHHTAPAPIAVVDSVAAEIIDRHHGVATGAIKIDPLDAHQYLCRYKLAGVLALLAERRQINDEDWALAGMIMATSVSVRSTILETAKLRRYDTVRAAGERQAVINDVVQTKAEERATRTGARAIARRVHRESEPQTRKQLRDCVDSRDRKIASIDTMIDHALASHWVVLKDGYYGPGDSMPT